MFILIATVILVLSSKVASPAFLPISYRRHRRQCDDRTTFARKQASDSGIGMATEVVFLNGKLVISEW